MFTNTRKPVSQFQSVTCKVHRGRDKGLLTCIAGGIVSACEINFCQRIRQAFRVRHTASYAGHFVI